LTLLQKQVKDSSAFAFQLRLILMSLLLIAGQATPLHRAAANGKLEVCKLLLQSGADVNKADGDGKTSLQRAKSSNHLSVVQFLVERGAM